ncbi:MAG: ABC transporter permease [Candidatus Methanoperedens sp.]|uniref:ABC transporter permease n=1 Tax=Candidatus Methanoperedens sp. BLZ2 TaxID=2035255 RepID=UPI000BE314B0|nr:FtsX-like permease family protein [Candidatus Methanoperedens sp. BLZ2]KAB2947570.1 MAG: ABC transporter permease [Candidatus Methanoperedens sp.]MBZ0177583.1 ABC transporter permease [Candidatus Methanoperedens nitroreducens]MCX9078067.1 ABC transporter permease [Candidatus Methanoperedens sp.]
MSSVFFYARKDAKKNWKMFVFVIMAIAISTANIIIINGFMDGLTDGFLEKTMDTSSGHINIYPNEQDKYIEGLGIKEKKLDGLDGVVAYSPRITAGGTLHYKEKFKTIKILALDPSKENEVTILLSKIDSGKTLAANDRDGILISYRLADDLKVKIGDEATIVFENGKIRVFKIRGILHTGLAMDTNTIIINFEDASEQLNLFNKASIILVKLQDGTLSGQYKNKISGELGIQKIKEWEQEIESVLSSFKTFRDISNFMNAIGLFTGAVSVGIVLYINILHRRRQIGILKAIGMKDSQVLFVYILQAVFLGIIGILIGDALGYAGTKYLEAHPFPDPTLGSLGPRFHLSLIYDASLVTMLIIILAAAIPALMASRTNIIKAIWGE